MSSLRFRIQSFALAVILAGSAAANTAIQPVPRETPANWKGRHEAFVERARQGGIKVLFLGDSITDGWRNEAKGVKVVWDREFALLGAENFGIGGDRTQHVLWRLEHGTVEGIKPKVLVLMIGTNNTGFEPNQPTVRKNTPEETVAGVTAVVKSIRSKLPETKILLLAIFPRGQDATDVRRQQVFEINRSLARLHDGKYIHFLDIGRHFLEPDGTTLTKEIMPDYLHLSLKGYEIWAAAIREPLARLLK